MYAFVIWATKRSDWRADVTLNDDPDLATRFLDTLNIVDRADDAPEWRGRWRSAAVDLNDRATACRPPSTTSAHDPGPAMIVR